MNEFEKNCWKSGGVMIGNVSKGIMQCSLPFYRTLLERRTRLLSSKASVMSASGSSDFQFGVLPSTSSNAEPPAQPRRPAPPLPPERSKKESKKRRPAPAVPPVTGRCMYCPLSG